MSRVQAAMMIVVFVLSSLAGLVHEATTRHVQCPEHGEQIDSDARDAVAGAAAAQLALHRQPAAASHGHEHCLIASATRTSRLAPCAPAIGAAPVLAATVAIATARVAGRRGAAVYRMAPKTSPPG